MEVRGRSLSEEQALTFYQGLLDQTLYAADDFFTAVYPWLSSWLQRSNAGLTDDLCADAAITTLQGLIENPRSFDSTRGSLLGFIRMAAKRDLLNLIDQTPRARAQRRGLRLVELPEEDGEYLVDGTPDHDPEVAYERTQQAELPSWLRPVLDMSTE